MAVGARLLFALWSVVHCSTAYLRLHVTLDLLPVGAELLSVHPNPLDREIPGLLADISAEN